MRQPLACRACASESSNESHTSVMCKQAPTCADAEFPYLQCLVRERLIWVKMRGSVGEISVQCATCNVPCNVQCAM